jgi:ribose 5-phosphate isomerase B
MRIAFGSDQQTHLTETVIQELRERGHEVVLMGALAGRPASWPVAARQVAEAIVSGLVEEGILACWTGTGVSIAANKLPGIRAALCGDAETARGARLWNRANVLCLSNRRTSEVVAHEILETWFATSYQANPEDDACLAQVEDLEQDYSKPG